MRAHAKLPPPTRRSLGNHLAHLPGSTRTFQELIKRWGEEKGFRAVLEEQIPGEQGERGRCPVSGRHAHRLRGLGHNAFGVRGGERGEMPRGRLRNGRRGVLEKARLAKRQAPRGRAQLRATKAYPSLHDRGVAVREMTASTE